MISTTMIFRLHWHFYPAAAAAAAAARRGRDDDLFIRRLDIAVERDAFCRRRRRRRIGMFPSGITIRHVVLLHWPYT